MKQMDWWMVLQMVLQFLDCFQSGEDGYIDLLRLSSSWLLAIAVSPAPKGEFTLGNLFQMLGMLEVYIYSILFNLVVGENVSWQPLAWNTSVSSCQKKKHPTQVASFADMHLTSHGMIHFWMLPWDFPWVGRKFQGPPQSTSFPSFSEAHQLLTWTTSPSTCHVAGVDCGPRIMNNVWTASTNNEVFGKPVEAAGHN